MTTKKYILDVDDLFFIRSLKTNSKKLKLVSEHAHKCITPSLQKQYYVAISEITTLYFHLRFETSSLLRRKKELWKKRWKTTSENDHPSDQSLNQGNLHMETLNQDASPEFEESIIKQRPILKIQPIYKRKHFRKNRNLRQYFIFISFYVLENLQLYFFRNIAFRHVVAPLIRNKFYFLFGNRLNLEKFFLGFIFLNFVFYFLFYYFCFYFFFILIRLTLQIR